MLTFKQTALAVALASASITSAYAVTFMNVTGGTFKMGAFGSASWGAAGVGTGGADITDQYNPPGWTTTVPQANGVVQPGSISSFQFGTNPGSEVNTFTAAIDPQSVDGGGHPMPVYSGAFVNGTSSFDFSSFYANWNGNDFNQGNAAVTLTLSGCAGTSCNFSMAWSSLIVGGPFGGNTGKWTLTGTISAVPEASTYGMMVAGLGMVGLAARRRKNKAAK